MRVFNHGFECVQRPCWRATAEGNDNAIAADAGPDAGLCVERWRSLVNVGVFGARFGGNVDKSSPWCVPVALMTTQQSLLRTYAVTSRSRC